MFVDIKREDWKPSRQGKLAINMFLGIKREDWKPSRQEKLAINMFLGIYTKKSITKKK